VLIAVFLYVKQRKNNENQRSLLPREALHSFEIKDKHSVEAPKENLKIKEKTIKKRFIVDENIPDEFVIFDLETTGFKTNKKPVDIIELSAIKIKKNFFRYLITITYGWHYKWHYLKAFGQ
jgi:DNA polymerase III epsilon subunit-like protein